MRQGEVMGRGLSGDRQPAGLSPVDRGDRTRRRNVGDVEPATRGQGCPAGPLDRLDLRLGGDARQAERERHGPVVDDAAGREASVLAVADGHRAGCSRPAKDRLEHFCVGEVRTVVAERDGPRGLHRVQVGGLAAGSSAGHRPDGKHARQACFASSAEVVRHGLGRIHRRVGVRHGADGRKAAPDRRRRACLDRLRQGRQVRPSDSGRCAGDRRLAQVDVQVNEARRDDASPAIENAPGPLE